MRNLKRRVLTALVGIAGFVAALYVGGWVFGVVILFVALAAQYEVYRLFECGGLSPWIIPGLILGALVGLRALVPDTIPLAVAFVVVLVAYASFSTTERPLDILAATVVGAVYPTLLFTFLTELRLTLGEDVAVLTTLGTLVLIWVSDIMAYVAGNLFGKHLLAPSISPGKTWEGAAAGLAASLLLALLMKPAVADFLRWQDAVVLAILCGGVSQLGDLAESRFKRAVGVKDSGTLLPGPGGFLDRFDGVIVAVPLAYLYLKYVAGMIG